MAKIISFSIVILVILTVCCPTAGLHEADAEEIQGQSAAGTIVSSFSVTSQTVEPQGIEFLNNYLYVSRGEDPYRKIYQYDTQGNLVQVISTSNGCPRELTWDGAYFWHPDTCFHKILKIDTLGNTIRSFVSPYTSPCAIAWDGTDLWLSFAGQGNKIFRMDTSGNLTGDSITTPTADYPSGLVFVGGYFWVSGYTDEKIYQVDMAGNIVSSFDAPGTQPAGLAFDGKYLWHTDTGTDRVYQIQIDTAPMGSLQVTISPEGAIDAGAQWRVDGGVWHMSGYTQSVPVGEHTLEFSDLSGWDKPGNETLTISEEQTASVMRTYTANAGSLQVIISPQDAVEAGARWRIEGGLWQVSGYTQMVSPGQHSINFSDVLACGKPSDEVVTISAGQKATVSEIYTDCTPGALVVNIYPQMAIDAGARWRVDEGAWQVSGYTEWILAGQHFVEFSFVSGLWKPASRWVTTTFGQTTLISEVYTYCDPSLLVTIRPQEAIDAGAKWRRVGTTRWLESGMVEPGFPCDSEQVIIEFSDIAGWTKPSNQTLTISSGHTMSATGTYVLLQVGSLQVTIVPQAAIDAGAKWRVDGGAWHDSGDVQQLPVGQHTVDFNDAWGCIKPNNRTVTITEGQTTHLNEIYCDCTPGALMVNIYPPEAINAGAQWRVDGGTWQASGDTQWVSVGQHLVEFSDVSGGWTKPASRWVTTTAFQTASISGVYIFEDGPLQVIITPQAAIDAGAQWRVDGGTWHDSGESLQELPVGPHTVEFNDVSGCGKPSNQIVTIRAGQWVTLTGTYTDCTPGALLVIICPQGAIDAGARWRRVGTNTWLDSGVPETGIPLGQHTVEFSDVTSWTKPDNQWVTAIFGQTATASATYVPLCSASLIVTINPQEVINAGAKWRRVGTGTWLDSGYTETGIPCGGEQTVEFNDIPGWTKPPNQSVTISDGQTATVVGSFDAKPVSFPFFDDFSTDKGWSGYEAGGWERGPVLKGHAERGYSDPASDHSLNEDNFVLGFAIGGNYPNGISETKWIISPPIDCTGQEQVFLKFWRYLNVQGNKADRAAIYVSKDGTEFYRVWENPRSFVCDSHWVRKVYDISAIAANQATVYIAFGMGPTNSSGQFSGWNIDDVEVTSWYSISGFIRDRAGTPIPDVEVCFSDEFGYQIRPCVVSDEYGYYVQYGFEPYSFTKSYVYIIPSEPEFYFSPSKKKVRVINTDIKVNFRAFSPIRRLGGE